MSGPNHIGAFERRVRALCEGFRRELPPSVERVRLGGEEMPFAEVLAALQAMESTFDAVHDARQRYRQAVGDRRRAMKAHRSTYEDMVVFLKHYLGKASPRLTSFGVALPKGRRALTAEASAIARAKAAATRKARVCSGSGSGWRSVVPVSRRFRCSGRMGCRSRRTPRRRSGQAVDPRPPPAVLQTQPLRLQNRPRPADRSEDSMTPHLRLVGPGEVGARRRVDLRPCRCGHHLLCHSPLTGKCMWRGCACPAWRESPPRLRPVPSS